MDSNQLLLRSKEFALSTIRFFQMLPKSDEARILGKQLLRSSTSVAANYCAANRARSKQEFFAKLCIVVEECDESLFWMELLTESDIINNSQADQLMKEAEEILRIFSASRKTMKGSL
ncbi:MAG: four helix bundle protein [Bacteroidales bacterium]|nr:four helix bundle protein [Bacteroidales bacterium]